MKELYNIFSVLSSKDPPKTFQIDKFIYLLKSKNQSFNNDDHHDAHEFLTWLLDTLENELQLQSQDINNTNNNYISKLFRGIQISNTKCLICEKNVQVKEPYYYISVDIEQNVSLVYCLKRYIKKELMRNNDKFYCDKCNCLQEAERQVQLNDLPPVLIIQLKRFKMYEMNQIQKLNSLVNIPKDMNFDFLLNKSIDNSNNTNINNTEYILRSIIIHSGNRGEYGHYFALVRIDLSDNWFICNDETCMLFTGELEEYYGNPDENYQLNTSQSAYLLFYEKINKDNY